MYNTQILEGRVFCDDAKVIAKTDKGLRILDNVYLEATVPMKKYYEPAPVEWGIGYFDYDFAVDVDDLDQGYSDHEECEIKEVLKIIKASWEIEDEWQAPSCWEDCEEV